MNIPKFSVCSIGRNEATTLPRLLESLKEFFDRCGEMVYVDTGSKDGTPDIARAAGCRVYEEGDRFRTVVDEETAKKINEKFVVHHEPEIIKGGDSFFSFYQARNYAYSLAKNDFICSPDCDEAWTVLNIDRINELIDEGYERMLTPFVYAHNPDGTPAVAFDNDARFADRRKVQWVGIIHETQKGEAKMTRLTKDVAYLEHWQNRGTDRSKYLSGLAWACYMEPENDRNSHYFARELMYRGYYRSAIKEFGRHIEMDKWDDERGQSMVYLGNCYHSVGERDKALECWNKVVVICGNRREPFINLAQFWKRQNSPVRVASYAAAALQIPNNGFYGNLVQNYTYEPHYLMYWAKGWMGDIPAAREHLLKCLEYHPTDERFLGDMKYYFNDDEIREKTGDKPYPNLPETIDLRKRLSANGVKVLNVGVGPGTSWLAQQLPYWKFKQLDHVDINQEYLDNAKKLKWASKEVNFINCDIRKFEYIDDYDLIMMFDVLEHMPKEDSLELLKSKPPKVVFCPVEKTLDDNLDAHHVSLWTEQDFIDLGFKTEFLPGFFMGRHRVRADAVWAIKGAENA